MKQNNYIKLSIKEEKIKKEFISMVNEYLFNKKNKTEKDLARQMAKIVRDNYEI